MSLDIYFERTQPVEVFWRNITHNLTAMASACDLYELLWRPEEVGVVVAADMIERLEIGLAKLKGDPAHFQQFNASNGWGKYEHFVQFVEAVLFACREFPDATVRASR